jgi:hypothetical protein
LVPDVSGLHDDNLELVLTGGGGLGIDADEAGVFRREAVFETEFDDRFCDLFLGRSSVFVENSLFQILDSFSGS